MILLHLVTTLAMVWTFPVFSLSTNQNSNEAFIAKPGKSNTWHLHLTQRQSTRLWHVTLGEYLYHASLVQTVLPEASSNKRTDTSSIFKEFSSLSIGSTGMEAFNIFTRLLVCCYQHTSTTDTKKKLIECSQPLISYSFLKFQTQDNSHTN